LNDLVGALAIRGVNEKAARRLLFGVPGVVDVQEQIEGLTLLEWDIGSARGRQEHAD
jgi:hypothetical protein